MNEKDSLFEKVSSIIESSKKEIVTSINKTMLATYFEIGRLIVEEEQKGTEKAKYGDKIISNLSLKLKEKYGQGYSKSNLKLMRKFYLSGSIGQTSGFLTRSHISLILNKENKEELNFYLEETIKNEWSVRELKREIRSCLYERTLLGYKMINNEKSNSNINTLSFLKDPFVLEFLDLPTKEFLEKDLEKEILKQVEKFLLEFGRGFSFVTSQKRININGLDYYIDLVFYNIILKCYVLVDLKIDDFKPEYIGQMHFYLSYYKEEINNENDNEPLGIILCKEKNEYVVKYALKDINNIFAARYSLVLPNKDLLEEQLNLLQKEELSTIEKNILKEMKNEKFISIRKISRKLNLSKNTTKKYLNILKKKKIIKRVENEKNDYYEIIEEIDVD